MNGSYKTRGATVSTDLTHQQTAVSRPLSDEALEAAIISLEASTAAIEKQYEALESQRRALDELKARNTVDRSPTPSSGLQRKKFARQRAELDFDIEELSHALHSRVKAATKQADSITADHPSHVERLLDKDNRLLDGLHKLLPVVSRSASRDDDSTETEKLCATLTMLYTKEIQARLDAAYVQSLATASQQPVGSREPNISTQQVKQRETLTADLSELGSEVDGLIAIVIENRYQKPLKQSQESMRAELQAQKASWGQFVKTTLQYLIARLDRAADQMKHVHAHKAALRSIGVSLNELVAASTSDASAQNSSAAADKSNARGLKPLRLVQANMSETQDPAAQLFRQLGVRTGDFGDVNKLRKTLDAVLRERTDSLSQLSRSTELGTKHAMAQSLDRAEADIQKLLTAVYAHTQYGSVSLVAPQVQADLNELERQTQRLGDDMRDLDIDGTIMATRAKLEEITQKLET